jgi:Asp-tRNA(Asn)/Glu-tRNA(Gln) amidotransferase A subunit family amidase
MALSYTMDKVGPICRKVEDCALVLAAIAGHDPHDPSSIQQPFNWRPKMDVKKLKIGILDTKEVPADSMPINKTLHDLGFDVKRVKMTPAEDILEIILAAESASAFDAFTRSNDIHDLKNSAWPAYFRYARHIPAVEYLQAHRMRALLMERFEQEFGDRDIIIGADITESILLATNLTGHPQVIIPNGTDSKGLSKSLSFIGRLYREDSLLLIAELVQDMSDFHRRRPNL